MRPKTWVNLTLALAVFATIILLAGVFSPLWIFLDSNGYMVGVGLLYRVDDKCTIDANEICVGGPTSFATVKYSNDLTNDKVHWSAMAGLEVGGAAMGVILVILFIVYANRFEAKKSLNRHNILLMVAAILTWLPVGAGLIIFAIYHGDAFTNGPDISSRSFPWSALMCFVAAILFVFITILVRSRCLKEDYITHVIPASVDSRWDLYPSSKSSLINRYFAPPAYREDHIHGLGGVLDHEGKNGAPQNGGHNNSGAGAATASPYLRAIEQQQQQQQQHQQHQQQMVVSRTTTSGYYNRGFESEQVNQYNNQPDTEHRRLTTEVVLDRHASGQNVDFDNEGKGLIIYQGKDHIKKIDDAVAEARGGRQGFVDSTNREFLYSAQHLTDRDAHTGPKYMVHTDKPGEISPTNKRLVLSPTNFTDTSVKYNPTFAYRPYSEQVY